MTEEQSVEKLQEKLQAMKAQREADVQAQRDELEAESKQNTRVGGLLLQGLGFVCLPSSARDASLKHL